MQFVKMHGCGNDYIYVNGFEESVRNPALVSRKISDRHTGVGSDGLILILPSKSADFRMRMFNADGSEGKMCGNGIRCIGKYVYERGLTKSRSLTVETAGGVVGLQLAVKRGKVATVTVDMGVPRLVGKDILVGAKGKEIIEERRIALGGKVYRGHILSMGNPHCVIFVGDPDFPLFEAHGRTIECHRLFPSRVNVEFVRMNGRGRAYQRTWERGSGETLACGSGACAVATAAFLTGRGDRTLKVRVKGGELVVSYREDGHIYLTGPAVEVCRGEWQ